MENNKYEYSVVVCNFLNNTKGYIEDYQVRFLLLNLFDLEVSESVFEKYFTKEIEEKLSMYVECDNSGAFYECIYFDLYKVIKGDMQYDRCIS